MLNAVWLFVSALLVAYVAPSITRQIKLAEFRQAWINDLRLDIAEYLSKASEWAREYDKARDLLIGDTLYVGTQNIEAGPTKRMECESILFSIKLRINPRQSETKAQDDALLASLAGLLETEHVLHTSVPIKAGWSAKEDAVILLAREVLKREWEVAKTAPPIERAFAFLVAKAKPYWPWKAQA